MGIANTHYVCLPCRTAYKKPRTARAHVCPQCGGELLHAGSALATPKRRDAAAWRTLAVVLRAGLDYDQSCCGCGPGYRPRSPRDVRVRQAHARRTGQPVARALAMCDPSRETDRFRRPGAGAWAGAGPWQGSRGTWAGRKRDAR